MAFFASLLTKIKKLFFVLFSVLKKPFCCRKRSRRNSGNLLPVTIERSNKNLESFSGYPSNTSQTNRAQNQHNSQYTSNSVNSNVISQKNNFQSNASQINRTDSEDNEPETDFFSDMVPRIKKPKKVGLILSKNNF